MVITISWPILQVCVWFLDLAVGQNFMYPSGDGKVMLKVVHFEGLLGVHQGTRVSNPSHAISKIV